MTRFKFLLFVAVLVGFPALAYAGYDDGKAAYDRGDYATAYKEFKALAEQGDAFAQFVSAGMYFDGKGVTQDYAEAVKWYHKSADQGYADAQVALGYIYDKGLGVPQDNAEAMKWYHKAADQGNARAKAFLGE